MQEIPSPAKKLPILLAFVCPPAEKWLRHFPENLGPVFLNLNL
jgi:hypothetical protein